MANTRTKEHTQLLNNVGWLIRQYRKERGYTLEQMAGMLGIRKQSLGHMELGDRSISLYRAVKICEVLNIDINKLVYARPNPSIHRHSSARICRNKAKGDASAAGPQG